MILENLGAAIVGKEAEEDSGRGEGGEGGGGRGRRGGEGRRKVG